MHAYLTGSYWALGRTRERQDHLIDESYVVGLYHEGAQVGFARAVDCDAAHFVYLADVYVLEEHRGHGLGKWLMRTVTAHPCFTGARRVMLGTLDAHGLYRQFGFTDAFGSRKLMEIVRPDIYSSTTAGAATG